MFPFESDAIPNSRLAVGIGDFAVQQGFKFVQVFADTVVKNLKKKNNANIVIRIILLLNLFFNLTNY